MLEIKTSLIEQLIAKITPTFDGLRVFKPKKVYKPMVTSTQEEIDLHNSKVSTRQVVRSNKRLDKKLGKI